MYEEDSCGIAAVQVGFLLQALILDVGVLRALISNVPGSEEITKEPYFIINPKILYISEKKVTLQEGCLSVRKEDGITLVSEDVERPESITIEYTGLDGDTQILSFDGSKSLWDQWCSRCLQHEIAHLKGEIFTDYLVNPVNQPIIGVIDVSYDDF